MAQEADHAEHGIVPGGIFTGSPVAPPGTRLSIQQAQGCYITTDAGDQYIDYKLGSGPMIVGHAHPEVVEAIRTQAAAGTTYYLPNPPALRLAERIVDAVPCAEQIKFTASGTEATYLALRLARAHTGREKVLTFEGAYHGWHDHALISSSKADAEELLSTDYPRGTIDSAGIPGSVAGQSLVAPFNDLETTTDLIETHASELAGVLVEPEMRMLAPADGFLEGLREACSANDVVLIFDEVVTGFRFAWGGAQEFYGVTPDLATLGKAIGGGTPLAAVCGAREIMGLTAADVPREQGGVVHAGTLNGNPLGAAAGNATLDILARDGTYDDLHGFAESLRAMFVDVLGDAGIDAVAVGEGPMVDYVITDQPTVRTWRDLLDVDTDTKSRIDRELFDQGILKAIGGKMYLSTAHGPDELDRTTEAFTDAVATVS